MNNNKKFLLYGSIAVLLLIITITVLFLKLSAPKKIIEKRVMDHEMISVLQGVPSDAIMIFDFKHLANFAPMLNDTSSFAELLLDKKNPIVQFQQKLVAFKEIADVPFVYSLHYSAKNSVSFLQILDLSKFAGASDIFDQIREHAAASKRKYNSAYIYSYPNGLSISLHKNLILASNSSYVLESSIRHLENSTSILDNKEFGELFVRNAAKDCAYLNHRQIGKFFSGEIERRFLGYSDFFLQLTSWSVFDFSPQQGVLHLKGYFQNNNDEASFSNVFKGQLPGKSQMGKILPAGTIFAVSLPLNDFGKYISSLKLFLEVQKKLGRYNHEQQVVKLDKEPSPQEWIKSMQIEELVAAYCKFGEKCEWITFIREKKSSFGINQVLSDVMDKKKPISSQPFKYKGYIASVFGDIFAGCNEEAYCKTGVWSVIGPKKMIDEFASGNANYFSLENYLEQTPASSFLTDERAAKIAVNLKEAGDTVLQVLKPYMRRLLGESLKKNNFEYITLGVTPTDSGKIEVNLSFYATRLKDLPKPKVRENGEGGMKFEIDSSIILSSGPFEVYDVTKKSKAYLEQTPNMRLRYLDVNKKSVWAIPFEAPICGAVEQVDLFKNGKLQMLFISGDKLYALDVLARFVRGYPVKLPKKVVYGPSKVDIKGDKEYTFMVLNEDNTISWYGLDGTRVKGWTDIKAPEFVKELPEYKKIGNKSYWVLRAPSQMRLYTINGKEIVIADKKKKIDRESEVKVVTADEIKVKGTDGNYFILNLATGKTKKVK